MQAFTPLASLVGGVLIGLGAALLLLGNGRIAGVSGILGEALPPATGDAGRLWRVMFLLGLCGTGAVAGLWWPARFAVAVPGAGDLHDPHAVATLLCAGLLVGYGTRLSNGCTSGHGVCGLGRSSPRSLWATLTFMAAAFATVAAARHLGLGATR